MLVERVDYERMTRRLKVVMDDGTSRTFLNVCQPAADAMLASGSLDAHFKKYIQGIYIEQEAK